MQATITKQFSQLSGVWVWKVEIGFGHTAFFPIATPKHELILYATNNGADHVKIFTNAV